MDELTKRINELAHKAKTEGLTPVELKERDALRKEFLARFRAGFAQQLENTYVQTPDGEKHKLSGKNQAKGEEAEKPVS